MQGSLMLGHDFNWWLHWLMLQCGATTVGELIGFFIIVPTCLHLYFATCWDQIFASRIERHMYTLRYNAPWPYRWWHHPREGTLIPLFGHWFYTAYLFEVWHWITVRHGRSLLRRYPHLAIAPVPDMPPRPLSRETPRKKTSDQLEFDFA